MATILVRAGLVRSASDLKRGGHAMSILQWLHGLGRLGHDVICVDYVSDPHSAVVAGFRELVRDWWFPQRACLVDRTSLQAVAGLSVEELKRVTRRADALIDIGAPMTREPRPLLEDVRPRILIDRDPVLTHLWVEEGAQDVRDVYGDQDYYFTFGCNVGSAGCSISPHGLSWLPIWNPVIMDWWEPGGGDSGPFTTVASWWEGGYHEFEGQVIGPKAEQWRRFIALPERVREPLEIALDIEPDDPDVALLQRHGWRLVAPETAVGTPALYRDYIRRSAGEFSCAKGVYAQTSSGWFSDRSTCYLAAGRPVVVQATGFDRLLPTGRGLFSVSTMEEAADAIAAIRLDYALHSRAACEIAREYFDSATLLSGLLARVGIGAASPGLRA